MIRRCAVVLAFVVGACGSGEAAEPDSSTPSTPVPTVPGVGRLPDTVPVPSFDALTDADVPLVSVVVTRPVDDDGVVVEAIAERVNGNRLLVIGDSILASTASRYGGELCDALTPIGWSVAVDAEPARFVEFGNKVAERRLRDVDDADDFDAAIIHLGSNYGRDKDEYYTELSELLFRVAPRPTLLLTVTEYRPAWAEVNEVIEELASLYDNVTIIDWEKIARTPGVLSRDGLHPGNQGEAVLVELLAVALGELGSQEGECLRSLFTDDSAIGRGSGGSTGGSSTSGSSTSGSSGGSSTSGSTSGGTTSGSTSGGTTSGATTGGVTTTGTTDGTGATGGSDTAGGTTGATTDGSTTGDTTTDGSTTGGETDTTTGGTDTTGGTTGTTGGGATGTTGGATGTTSGGTTGGSATGTTGTTGGATSGATGSTTGSAAATGTDSGGTEG